MARGSRKNPPYWQLEARRNHDRPNLRIGGGDRPVLSVSRPMDPSHSGETVPRRSPSCAWTSTRASRRSDRVFPTRRRYPAVPAVDSGRERETVAQWKACIVLIIPSVTRAATQVNSTPAMGDVCRWECVWTGLDSRDVRSGAAVTSGGHSRRREGPAV